MDDKLVTIAQYHNQFEAQMVKDHLEADGIKATITGQNIHGLYPFGGMDKVQIQVFQKDVEKATQILELENTSPEHQEDNN